jgi:alpha-galactosidase
MSTITPFYELRSRNSSLVIDCRSNAPAILYWGAKLSGGTTPEMLALLATGQRAQARADTEAPLALSPETGAGFPGDAGIQVHRAGRHWGVYSRLTAVTEPGDNQLELTSECSAADIEITHFLSLDHESDVLSASTQLRNTGSTALSVEACHAPCIPLPMNLDRILGFEGRWANEYQLRQVHRFAGSYLRENRGGRTSHECFPGVVLHCDSANESHGEVYGLHLGWSGNHRVRVETLPSGKTCAQLGELFMPGEMTLEPGERYRSPCLYGVHTHDGFSGMSRSFHRFVRSQLCDERMRNKLKLVHFNTWEALYFDMSPASLCKLADEAAAVGVERFVLDDGWFRMRHADNAGLGDWFVDEQVFPDGLGPVIDHINALGMEFGLWVEPEMVNPDSDLYRAHPDWALNLAPAPLLMSRNQLVLDLTRPEVGEYLFERIDALLTEYPITYLKWDMNRDLDQPGGADGRAVTHAQTLAFYSLLKRVRDAHRTVEIESCSSGGARADFGVLAHTDRIWTSDSNDALDRLNIQKGFSFFFPAELMGAHVGPDECHITGRRISLAMRAGVALMGSMGIEANLFEMCDDDKAELKAAVNLHKKHRKLIFAGDLVRLDMESCETAFGIVSRQRDEAIFSYALLDTHPRSRPGAIRLQGLQGDANYRVSIIWPREPQGFSTSILDVIDGATVTGDALMHAGMQLPVLKPESLLLIHLEKQA